MRVGPNTATIRTSDLWLSGTQILMIAGLPRNERDQMLRRINGRMVTMGLPFRITWVSFEQGLWLCEKYGIRETLGPLL